MTAGDDGIGWYNPYILARASAPGTHCVWYKAVGDAEADMLLSGPAPRKGWEHYYKV